MRLVPCDAFNSSLEFGRAVYPSSSSSTLSPPQTIVVRPGGRDWGVEGMFVEQIKE